MGLLIWPQLNLKNNRVGNSTAFHKILSFQCDNYKLYYRIYCTYLLIKIQDLTYSRLWSWITGQMGYLSLDIKHSSVLYSYKDNSWHTFEHCLQKVQAKPDKKVNYESFCKIESVFSHQMLNRGLKCSMLSGKQFHLWFHLQPFRGHRHEFHRTHCSR